MRIFGNSNNSKIDFSVLEVDSVDRVYNKWDYIRNCYTVFLIDV